MSHPYFPHTTDEINEMLAACGATNLEELYSDIPAQLKLKAQYRLAAGISEPELREYFEQIKEKCKPLVCFAGAGAYDHYTPAIIPYLTSRSEYATAYTPYQPEISQGTLQYIFEYQSMMCSLTGMDVCNASMYDGATATAEAILMAVNSAKRRRRVLISATLDPKTAQVVATYARYNNIILETIPEHAGTTDHEEIRLMLGAGDVAAVVLQTPNYYGIVENLSGLADTIHQAKALFIINSPASPLAVIKPAGEWGADIAVGDAQSLGMPLDFGGPYLGYMCCTKSLMRKMPGRIVGATRDESGQRVFVLTLQAREQHIRREKATSNICSNQGIMTLHAGIYLSLMGPEGLAEVNRISADCAHTLASELEATGRMHLSYPAQPFLNEFTMTMADPLAPGDALRALQEVGILGGVAVGGDKLLIACTEKRTRREIDLYVSTIKSLPL